MKRQGMWIHALVAIALLGWTSAPTRAEIAAETQADGRVNTLMMAIVEHPDPVGLNAWAIVRPQAQDKILNFDGFARGDGRPDVVIQQPSGLPAAVWSYNSSIDHDIAFSEWLGEEWSPIEFVTQGVEDELDPRAAIGAENRLYVVWWTSDATDNVYLAERLSGEGWTAAIPVTTMGSSRRPSLVVHQGVPLIAYERDSPGSGDTAGEVVVARRESDGTFTHEVVATTTNSERLDPVLHSIGGFLWVDWKHSESEFGRAIANNFEWGLYNVFSWSDPSWIGVEEKRKEIQHEVVLP